MEERYHDAQRQNPTGLEIPEGWRYIRGCYVYAKGDLHIETTLFSTHGECGSWRFHSHGRDVPDNRVPAFLIEMERFVKKCFADWKRGEHK